MNKDQSKIYKLIADKCAGKQNCVISINGKLFEQTLEYFPPYLQPNLKLKRIYAVSFHRPSHSLIIANKGATLIAKCENSLHYVLRHTGLLIIHPTYGIECVDVGINGNLNTCSKIILRPESACSPSFLMNSQRCNCYDQWSITHQLISHFNQLPRKNMNQTNVEQYLLKNEIEYKSRLAFVLIHLSSQNGMGSGSNMRFRNDIYETAHMRHRGEYTAEQVFHTSMAGGFKSINLKPDPRSQRNLHGYSIIPIVLDYLHIKNKKILLLSNNLSKEKVLLESGFHIRRLSLYGRIDKYDLSETYDRIHEFGHIIPDKLRINKNKEFKRLKNEIKKIIKSKK
jgi:GTP cyclohydrolase II